MSYSGINLASSSNQYLPPNVRDQEATATTRNIQDTLGIVRDTLLVPFSEIGKHDIWKYQSNSSRPSLPPAHTLRMGGAETQVEENKSWIARREELIKELPEDIQNALSLNRGLPRESQYSDFIALDEALATLAKALVFIESAGEPVVSKSRTEGNQNLNQQIPGYANDNYGKSANEVLDSIRDKMTTMGRNNPGYDDISYYASLTQEGVDALNNKGTAAE